MAPFPLPLSEILGSPAMYIVYLFIGIAFGYVLEISGFGQSTKLAAQFYFKDMTVLKVMFGAIVVAMLLIFLTTGLGLLDYNLIWVNPTYLVPGIVGGLIMGAGFIIGGFCPGTSLVAAATAKLDGVMFVLGVFFGIFLFGETVGLYEDFWNSTYMGRFTLMDLFNAETGVIVLAITLAAIVAFFVAERAEQFFGDKEAGSEPRWRYLAVAGVVALGFAVMFLGQPTTADKIAAIEGEKLPELEDRAYQIHPGELMANIHDNKIKVMMLDVRSESEYNQFHIEDAIHVPLAEVGDQVDEFMREPSNTLFVVMSNDEAAATEAWWTLTAESVPNVYILSGGINNWLDTYSDDEFREQYLMADAPDTVDELHYSFPIALGARHPAAVPNPDIMVEYESKVKMETKRAPASGGCG